jgi:predicted ATPase
MGEFSPSNRTSATGFKRHRCTERTVMKRFILTGAPGAGKTAIIRQLERDGLSVVEEAATDVIALEQARGTADPWTNPSFIDSVANLQKQRQMRASCQPDEVQFHDRSPVCTAALAAYLGHPLSTAFSRELDRILAEGIYQHRVFFIRNLGFITPTEARRVTFEEALHFERVHEETYRRFGFERILVEPAHLLDRVAVIKAAL